MRVALRAAGNISLSCGNYFLAQRKLFSWAAKTIFVGRENYSPAQRDKTMTAMTVGAFILLWQ